MNKKVTAIIVDDEPLARQLIHEYLLNTIEVQVVAECSNGFEALKSIQELTPDLVFLDIQMPKVDGFELLEVLDHPPVIIFTTAYDQYAIRAFEANAVDYLLKPFSKERFNQALSKAIHKLRSLTPTGPEPLNFFRNSIDRDDRVLDRIVVRQGSKIVVIPVEEVYYFESQDDYVMIHSTLGRFLKEKTMQFFEHSLPSNGFLRIHRSCLINLSYVTGIELYEKNTHMVVMKNGAKLRASQEGYKRLRGVF